MSKTAKGVAVSVDPDQTPCSVVSDLGLHCLHRSIYQNTIKVNRVNLIS